MPHVSLLAGECEIQSALGNNRRPLPGYQPGKIIPGNRDRKYRRPDEEKGMMSGGVVEWWSGGGKD
jgi:hypothetical protein